MAASLENKVIFGLKTDVASNAHYITETDILYPVSNAVAIHNFEECRQKLIRLSDEVNVICVAPNRKYVAIGEVREKPVISIYDAETLQRKKTLGIPYDAADVSKFTCMGFSPDSQYLAALTSDPDQTMLHYNWEKGKVDSSFKVGTLQNPAATINILSYNPFDKIIGLGGPFVLKCLTLGDNIWRQFGFSKAENITICSMTWLSLDRLLVGTRDGRIFYIENGELKKIYKVADTVSMTLKIEEEFVIPAGALQGRASNWEFNVRGLISWQTGFAYAFGKGEVIVFEKHGAHNYVKRNIYVIPTQSTNDEDRNLYEVNSLDISPNFSQLIVTTKWPQLFYATLWGRDIEIDPEPREMKVMGPHLHRGPINGLSMCFWKPMFVTCGEIDQTVRLWDSEAENLVLLKKYNEDVYSVALHPTGLFCLIGFSDKLRFMLILIDDLKVTGEFPIRNCKTVAFSNRGHLFAAVNGKIVSVYTTVGHQNHFTFKGHTGWVNSMVWSQKDRSLFTSDSEGWIYEWEMSSCSRIREVMLKTGSVLDIALSNDPYIIYYIANADYIQEINGWKESRKFHLPEKSMTAMVLGREDQVLLIGCPNGTILSVKCPLEDPVEYSEFHFHVANISKMCLSFNDQYLISASIDGGLCISRIVYADGKVSKVGKEIPQIKEVLNSKADLQEKVQTISDLMVQMRELETDHTYKLRKIQATHQEEIHELERKYRETIGQLRNKIHKMYEDHTKEKNVISTDITKMLADHKESMKKMETNYNAKLINEYDRYVALENFTDTMRNDYEKQLSVLEAQKNDELQKLVLKYEAQVHDLQIQLEKTQEEVSHQTRVHEALTIQIEDDADDEILEMRTNYAARLREEKELHSKLKDEVYDMRKRCMAAEQIVEDFKGRLQTIRNYYEGSQKAVATLEEEVTTLKKVIEERNELIRDKEREIYNLNRTNEELEGFQVGLDCKIDELKSQIEPKDVEIRSLKNQIRDMNEELTDLCELSQTLEFQLNEVQTKLGKLNSKLKSESDSKEHYKQILKRVRVDIHNITESLYQPRALESAVIELYQKYSSDKVFLRNRRAELDVHCELLKQRHHLERAVAALQRQLSRDIPSSDKETTRLEIEMKREKELNQNLTEELSIAREQLKEARKDISYMNSLLGLNAKDQKPANARKKLQKALLRHDILEQKYTSQIQEYERVILALKDDVSRLTNKLLCNESRGATAPI